MINPRGGDFQLATSGDRNLAVDIGSGHETIRCRPYVRSHRAPPACAPAVPEARMRYLSSQMRQFREVYSVG